MSKKNRDQGAAAQTAPPEAMHQEAASLLIDTWPVQEPVIDNIVNQTLSDAYSNTVLHFERGKDVKWRVSKGHYLDKDAMSFVLLPVSHLARTIMKLH